MKTLEYADRTYYTFYCDKAMKEALEKEFRIECAIALLNLHKLSLPKEEIDTLTKMLRSPDEESHDLALMIIGFKITPETDGNNI